MNIINYDVQFPIVPLTSFTLSMSPLPAAPTLGTTCLASANRAPGFSPRPNQSDQSPSDEGDLCLLMRRRQGDCGDFSGFCDFSDSLSLSFAVSCQGQ